MKGNGVPEQLESRLLCRWDSCLRITSFLAAKRVTESKVVVAEDDSISILTRGDLRSRMASGDDAESRCSHRHADDGGCGSDAELLMIEGETLG